MRTILEESNSDLITEVEQLITALESKSVAPELVAYRDHLLKACRDIGNQVKQNLRDLERGQDEILPEVLSETQRLARELRLYNQRFAGPALRGLDSDRLSLRVIAWIHSVHRETRSVPGAVSTEEFGVWPAPLLPVIYFMPASAQYSLLYQPLYCHEFGHVLYAYHKPEMDNLVQDLQREIAELLEPLIRRNDAHAHADSQYRNVIVTTWYKWTQELFCDAVGLMIGGPAFIHSFNRYLRVGPRTEYHCPPEELRLRSHPVTWLRARLLARRARQLGCEATAQEMEQQWEKIAITLNASWDFYGFYEDDFLPAVSETLEDMLVEAEPYRFSQRDRGQEDWTVDSTPIHLLNRAWHQIQSDPENYPDWEQKAIRDFCSTPFRALS